MKGKTQSSPLVVGQMLPENTATSPGEDGRVVGAEVFSCKMSTFTVDKKEEHQEGLQHDGDWCDHHCLKYMELSNLNETKLI